MAENMLYGYIFKFLNPKTSCCTLPQILDGDHLEHRLLYSAVAEDMALRWGGGGVSLLDLGCGDAHYIAATLHSTGLAQHVGRYTGVDLAEPALEVRLQGAGLSPKMQVPLKVHIILVIQ